MYNPDLIGKRKRPIDNYKLEHIKTDNDLGFMIAGLIALLRQAIVDNLTGTSLVPLVKKNDVLEFYLKVFNDKEMRKYLSSDTPRDSESILDFLEEVETSNEMIYWLILTPEREICGHIALKLGVENLKENPYPFFLFSYLISTEFMGQGFASNAVGMLIKYLDFIGLIPHVYAYADERNTRSIAVLRKHMLHLGNWDHAEQFAFEFDRPLIN